MECIGKSPEGHKEGEVDREEPHELSVAGGHAVVVKGAEISFYQHKQITNRTHTHTALASTRQAMVERHRLMKVADR